MNNDKKQAVTLRRAERKDAPLILALIMELAEYERMSDEVIADAETVERRLFDERAAEVIIAEQNNEAAGFALFFHNYSTFLAKPGLYLEDLYVKPPFRGRGVGKALLAKLARTAVERGCGRMEWSCLDWNAPSIGFYRALGAQPMSDWTVYRLSGETLKAAALLDTDGLEPPTPCL